MNADKIAVAVVVASLIVATISCNVRAGTLSAGFGQSDTSVPTTSDLAFMAASNVPCADVTMTDDTGKLRSSQACNLTMTAARVGGLDVNLQKPGIYTISVSNPEDRGVVVCMIVVNGVVVSEVIDHGNPRVTCSISRIEIVNKLIK